MDETLVTKRERLRSRLCSVGRWLTRNFGQTAAAPYGAGLLVAAVIAGVSVVILAIILDRVTQGWFSDRKKKPPQPGQDNEPPQQGQ